MINKNIALSVIAGIILPLSLPLHAVELKLAHVYNTDHPWHKSALEIERRIEEKTDGRVDVKIYPSASLGSEQELLEQVIVGGVDIIEVGSGQIANIFKPMVITEMPYVFDGPDQVLKFFNSEPSKEMKKDFEGKFNVKLLGSSIWGIRHFVANKPIINPMDLEGFKLRVPEQMIAIETAKAMNATATAVPYAEAYLAMRQGVVDGIENPLSSIESMKFYEVGNTISKTGHVITTVHYAFNNESLSKLSKDDQKVVLDIFNNIAPYTAKLVADADEKALDKFKESNVKIIDNVDREAFRKITANFREKNKESWEDYGDLISIILKL